MSRVLAERRHLTRDLGGQATTSEMAEAVIASLQ
jgi:isocitrate/isopropylmalate dehydrogenase